MRSVVMLSALAVLLFAPSAVAQYQSWPALESQLENLQRDNEAAANRSPMWAVQMCGHAGRLNKTEPNARLTRELCQIAVKHSVSCNPEVQGCPKPLDLAKAAATLKLVAADDAECASLVSRAEKMTGAAVGAEDISTRLREIRAMRDANPCAVLSQYKAITDNATETERAQTRGKTITQMAASSKQLSPMIQAIMQETAYRTNLADSAKAAISKSQEDRKIEELESALQSFKCLGDSAGEKAATDAVAEHKAWVAEEERCAADPKCQADRIVAAICDDMAQRRDVERQIASEKSYAKKAGVVNLSELQSLKELLQTYDVRIADGKAEYRGLTGRSWNGKCSR